MCCRFVGTVTETIYPQLILVVALAVLCYIWERDRDPKTATITITSTAHAIFGGCAAGCWMPNS